MSKRKILVLGNGTERFAKSRVDLRFPADEFDVDNVWYANGERPADLGKYHGVFITGSGHGAYEDIDWIKEQHELLQNFEKLGTPMMGVCFGSQILASALLGRDQVFRRPFCEVGFKNIKIQKRDEIFKNIEGESVKIFVWHNDEVKAGHPDAVILGSTDLCPNQIWRYKNQPIWGIQGHPELTYQNALDKFIDSRETFLRDGANIDELNATADECAEAKNLIYNFIDICRK